MDNSWNILWTNIIIWIHLKTLFIYRIYSLICIKMMKWNVFSLVKQVKNKLKYFLLTQETRVRFSRTYTLTHSTYVCTHIHTYTHLRGLPAPINHRLRQEKPPLLYRTNSIFQTRPKEMYVEYSILKGSEWVSFKVYLELINRIVIG